jgi:hypothetical protein
MLKVRKFHKYVKETKMRISEMSSSEFSEFVETPFEPQLLAVLEEIR